MSESYSAPLLSELTTFTLGLLELNYAVALESADLGLVLAVSDPDTERSCDFQIQASGHLRCARWQPSHQVRFVADSRTEAYRAVLSAVSTAPVLATRSSAEATARGVIHQFLAELDSRGIEDTDTTLLLERLRTNRIVMVSLEMSPP